MFKIKRSLNFTISSLQSRHSSFYIKGMFFKSSPKSQLYIWATLVKKYVNKKFQKSPNLVTLKAVDKIVRQRHFYPSNDASFWNSRLEFQAEKLRNNFFGGSCPTTSFFKKIGPFPASFSLFFVFSTNS